MKRHIKNAAIVAFWFTIIKLAIKLTNPENFSRHYLEDGVWLGLAVILTSYIIVFIIVLLFNIITKGIKPKHEKTAE